ncbi:MAG: pantoate--beta-alanine ligase [Candidatus Aminicenantes bacterium]|nr:pantoate--beta-alanine ligase [Candidatus Aminicenantes bacterium]
MKTLTRVIQMKEEIRDMRSQGKTIGFVPTMGYLHEGHLNLIRESLRKTDVTVVSIFVNPAQFGPGEDFAQYPRNLERDSEILKNEGVDCLFVPGPEEMFHKGHNTYVDVYDLKDKLCGRSRPIHFRGVCTVVLKLFNIVGPDVSYFGQKDAQQAIILKRMVEDLNLDVKIDVLPIAREEDGLALSSRNEYLNKEERKAALVLSKGLKEAQMMVEKGEEKSEAIIDRVKEMISQEPLVKMDYVEIVAMDNLDPVVRVEKETLAVLAVFVGKSRLVDNAILCPKE